MCTREKSTTFPLQVNRLPSDPNAWQLLTFPTDNPADLFWDAMALGQLAQLVLDASVDSEIDLCAFDVARVLRLQQKMLREAMMLTETLLDQVPVSVALFRVK